MNYVGDLWQFNKSDNIKVIVLDQWIRDDIEYVTTLNIAFAGREEKSGIITLMVKQLTGYYTKVS